ncbi:MAG: bifunctional 4-hydroxy-2-oxoglutarate aldolase/2-dehydro-3-deoxy-phosphogluconate aldolase [Chloroflexi bacterium]|nr:bifunctional 4-hydroxy-2-oxoglutarate aldolase/2-dehydro-3-deoxy-phosphogluconate aldolase [Chloroflexota bacterium]
MAKYSRLETLNAMVDTGLVPVFYHGDLAIAKKIVAACAQGGARCIEFTNRGDFAPFVFKDLAEFVAREIPNVILGVGSIVDAPTASLYIASGAHFVVGPVLNPEVARLCNRRKIAYAPGCATASEISQAEELGVEIVKIFPGGLVGGPEFVKSILAPMPWTRIMPTGGVEATQASVTAWIQAGTAALGIGSNLITKERIAQNKWDEIAQATAQVLIWIREARSK